jgi:glycerol-3-phosphate acyltransferase PlsY
MSFLLYGWSEVSGAVLIACVLIFWRHRTNIQSLLAGTESRIGRGSAGTPQN